MIALRGSLSRSHSTDSSSKGGWEWKGVWAFGTEMPPDPDTAKPFLYTWVEECKASEVEMPSFEEDDNNTGSHNQHDKNSSEHGVVSEQDHNTDEEMKDTSENHRPDPGEQKADDKIDLESHKSQQVAAEKAIQAANKEIEMNDALEAHLGSAKDKDKGREKELALSIDATRSEPETKKDHDSDQEKKISLNGGEQKDTSIADSVSEETKASETPKPDRASSATAKPKPRAITFATTSDDEPDFTEASTKHPERVPKDGRWDGYFENVAKRKNSANSKIKESFHIFLNATPAKDAQALFVDSTGAEGTALTQLKEGRVHVRGTGSNQFGTFELTGSLDLETGILECQRMYVITSDQQPKSGSIRRPSQQKKRDSTRSYSTRKRQLSWQRRSSLSDEEDEIVGMRRHVLPKAKRPRAPGRPALEGGFISSKRPAPSAPAGVATAAAAATAAAIAAGPKKRTGRGSSLGSPPSNYSPTSLHRLKLPLVGDPMEARWRSAHYLYYERHDPSHAEENGSNAGGTSTTSFVIYEGELLNGKCERDGRGVCLYNNGTMYEGEWRQNREHGKGTLMAADRRRVIYKGEWERGRMHGQGTYYYPQDESSLFPSVNVQEARYEGDFKENARHGNGKYSLSDGSTYEGEWRENDMNGRGTFVWPDNSVYIGAWKDGKRHGQGLLRASDGFTYDGMWVQNAMEGRGFATYPNGQTYEGLWANGRREGRGTIRFKDFAIYEGRFRDDCVEGQGTMKMTKNVTVPLEATADDGNDDAEKKEDWMIPISFQSDMGHIHQKAGFTVGGE